MCLGGGPRLQFVASVAQPRRGPHQQRIRKTLATSLVAKGDEWRPGGPPGHGLRQAGERPTGPAPSPSKRRFWPPHEEHSLKLGKAKAPVRVAVTGRTVGLPLFESLEVLGKDRTLARIDAALAKLAG